MEHEFSESEWKIFRELRQVALERFCKRVLDQVQQLPSHTEQTYHERYLELFRWLGERNGELAQAFNDPRRSQMLGSLQRSTLTAFSSLTSSPDSRRERASASRFSRRRLDNELPARQWGDADKAGSCGASVLWHSREQYATPRSALVEGAIERPNNAMQLTRGGWSRVEALLSAPPSWARVGSCTPRS